MYLNVIKFSFTSLGIELYILVWSYREDEVGHCDATTIYKEFDR